MVVNVCDAIMGAGKSQAAITMMNEDTEHRYIYITPYLDEVERIKNSCKDKNFVDPQNYGNGKLRDLHKLLSLRSNIASTHELFKSYSEETIRLIRNGGYTLVLDEAFQSVEIIPVSASDLKILLDSMIEVDDTGHVNWIVNDYHGRFDDLCKMCLTGNVILHKDCFMIWYFPVNVFMAFQDVYILTYLFDAQVQKYYFDVNGIDIKRIGVIRQNGVFRFSESMYVPEYVKDIKNKVHIVDDRKLNKIGDTMTNLSFTWYSKLNKKSGEQLVKQLRNNLSNLFKNKLKCSSDRIIWTVFKDYQDKIKGKGYTNGFVSCNVRATNAYRDRDCLAYCVNIYYNPFLKRYFQDHGVDVREDEYALSEMIQWIWRSAIRDGKEIWIYIPSKRMRELLQGWLKDLETNYVMQRQ